MRLYPGISCQFTTAQRYSSKACFFLPLLTLLFTSNCALTWIFGCRRNVQYADVKTKYEFIRVPVQTIWSNVLEITPTKNGNRSGIKSVELPGLFPSSSVFVTTPVVKNRNITDKIKIDIILF